MYVSAMFVKVEHDVGVVIPALRIDTKGTLQVFPRHIKLGRNVDGAFHLGNFDNRDGTPSVSMPAVRDGAVEGVVDVGRENIPAFRIGGFKKLRHILEVDLLSQKPAKPGAEVLDASAVGVMVERWGGTRQEVASALVDLAVRSQSCWPVAKTVVRLWWP
jgi:hypothetical protein